MINIMTFMPVLKLQNQLMPDSMDKNQKKRLRRGEFAQKWGEFIITIGIITIISLCMSSIFCFVTGSFFVGKAIIMEFSKHEDILSTNGVTLDRIFV
jgi:hypothetical protein